MRNSNLRCFRMPVLVLAMTIVVVETSVVQANEWRSLFDGKTLSQWQTNGYVAPANLVAFLSCCSETLAGLLRRRFIPAFSSETALTAPVPRP